MIDEHKILSHLISRKSLNRFAGDHKIAIKLAICAIFINIISGRHYGKSQYENMNLLMQLMTSPRNREDSTEIVKYFRPIVERSLSKNGFIPPYDNSFYDRILSLFRNNIQNLLDEGISFIQASDFEKVLDLEQTFRHPIKPYQWLDFQLSMHLTLNYPDMIIFSDLKALWNIYIEKWGFQQSKKRPENRKDIFENIVDPERRELDYTVSGLQRNLKFLIVSFVEAYLNSVYSNIIYEHKTNNNPKDPVFVVDKLNDIGIIEKILFKHFSDIKKDKQIRALFSKYRQIVKERDRYVHAISINSGIITGFEPILQINHKNVIESLQTGIDLVQNIENHLQIEFKALFWWYDDVISFTDEKQLSLTRKNSQYEQISFYD